MLSFLEGGRKLKKVCRDPPVKTEQPVAGPSKPFALRSTNNGATANQKDKAEGGNIFLAGVKLKTTKDRIMHRRIDPEQVSSVGHEDIGQCC